MSLKRISLNPFRYNNENVGVELPISDFLPLRILNLSQGLAVKESEERFLHDRGHRAVSRDRVRRPPGEEFLRDRRKLVPLHVLESELVADAPGLPIDVEDLAAFRVPYNEVITEAEDLLLHEVLGHGGMIA